MTPLTSRFGTVRTVGFGAALLAAMSLGGCNTLTKLSEVGSGPKTTPITNPTTMPGYRPVSLPMPAPQQAEDNPNSLWRAGARAFFKDHRAKAVGDILTIKLAVNDSGKLENKTERDREDSEAANVTNFLGYEAELTKILPQGANAAVGHAGPPVAYVGVGRRVHQRTITRRTPRGVTIQTASGTGLGVGTPRTKRSG